MRRIPAVLGLLLTLSIPFPLQAEEGAAWSPQATDTFVVDVANTIGYLVHADGELFSFPVATGQKEYVRYIGRSYNAQTPVRTWTVEEEQMKGDRRTFGVTGRFLRLFRNGESSPYGIHSYVKVDEWMADDYRYRSMGCIVVTEQILNIIEQTYNLAGHSLKVITTNDLQKTLSRM